MNLLCEGGRTYAMVLQGGGGGGGGYPGEYAVAGGEDAKRVEAGLARRQPLPAPAEVLPPVARRGVVRYVLLGADAGGRGGVGDAAVETEEVAEALGGAAGWVR